MFTGIIEELGAVAALDMGSESAVLSVRGPKVLSDATVGSSISVNGVCLTVVEFDKDIFKVDVMAETLKRSNLGDLAVGDPVNLERAMSASDRFGGHIVQGHVDGVATVLARTPGDRWDVVEMTLPADLARYVVVKGSIAVDGISLTVSALTDRGFEVSLIPTTLALTTLGTKQPGDTVNLEVDVIAKYVERMMSRDE